MRVKSVFSQRKAVERSFRNVLPGHYAPRLFCREYSGDTNPDLDLPVSQSIRRLLLIAANKLKQQTCMNVGILGPFAP